MTETRKQKREIQVVGVVGAATLLDMKRVALELGVNQSRLVTRMIGMALPALKKEAGITTPDIPDDD